MVIRQAFAAKHPELATGIQQIMSGKRQNVNEQDSGPKRGNKNGSTVLSLPYRIGV
jgi:hypothetical protein